MTKLDVMAVGAHPDDVELACGGTLALLAAAGRRVGIVHLTRGEMGTRGTPEQRRGEAESAAEVLGVGTMAILDCGDGRLRRGEAEEDALIELLRRHRPELVLAPPPADRHPDHGRAHDLVRAACFYAGLEERAPERGEPHRPGVVFHYMQHDPFEPDFVIDVTEVWEQRQEAVAAYRSQVFPGSDDPGSSDEAPTKIASEEFWRTLEARARHFGFLVGADFGEPFFGTLPLAVKDPMDLIPGGMP